MTELHTTSQRRSLRLLVATAAALVIGALTLAPRAVITPARGAFMRVVDAVTAPLLLWIPVGEAERVLNTLLFVPLGAAIALLLTRRAWPIAIVVGFALSATVEYAQLSIPGRVPDRDDVLWNTVGAAIGVVAITVPRLLTTAIARTRQRGSVTRT
jgi:hypothetical protein